ncbi:MAG: serine/threonine protein kinase [Candidatus Eremiobacteraeota bacterium]|nr:serine/threonine protein kinase [Candidatus Eremiobacteraeota bacterium]MCW5866740.1 serine/threonine protein kinase [Candidatus Eremiobacteraeota bacterium]
MLVWLISAWGVAQPVEVVEVEFRTKPATEVYLNDQLQPARQGKVTLYRKDFLTGQREDQRRLEFQDPQGDYQSLPQVLRWDQLQGGTFPPASQPPLQLALRSPLHFYGRRYGWLLALLSAFAAAGVWRFRRVRQRERVRQQQYEELSRQKVSDPDPNLGRNVIRWTLVKRLGQGANGTVYKALPQDSLDPRQAVAVKLVVPQNETDLLRLRNEIVALKSLDHGHIVKLLDFDWPDGYKTTARPEESQAPAPSRSDGTQVVNGTPALGGLSPISLVFEHVGGLSLADHLARGPLSRQEACRLFQQALEAMVQAHKLGVLHRDLKPANIMLDEKGNLKIIDFGLAKSPHTSKATQTGYTPGTPAYMAPEQIAGAATPSVDQWALGVIGYEMWCHQFPFKNDPNNFMVVMSESLHAAYKPFPEHVPRPVSLLLARMLEKDPVKRYPTLGEVYADWLQMKGTLN